MAAFDGSPSPVRLILVVENKTSNEEREDFTPVNLTLTGKQASRWKKIRQKEGIKDIDLLQLLLDRFESTSHLFDRIPGVSAGNTFVTSKGPIRITEDTLLKGKDADEGESVISVSLAKEATENDQENEESSELVVNQRQEDVGGTSQGDGTVEAENLEQEGEDFEGEDDSSEDTDFDSDPAGMKNKSDSDEYKPDSDSEWEEESDELSEEEDWDDEPEKKGKKKIPLEDAGVPFKRYDMKEVAKAEGVPLDETEDNRQRTRIRRLYWTDMMRSYHCKICSCQYANARHSSLHMLQEHSEMVGDLETFLKNKTAAESDAGVITMYSLVLEQSPQVAVDGLPLAWSVASKGEDQVDKRGGRDKHEQEEDIFDEKEFASLLMRWVDIEVTCQHCQQRVCRTGIFTTKGKEVAHLCRTGEPQSFLCDVCGKSFSQFKSFQNHWKEVHGEAEQAVCPYCGKMFKSNSMNQHIKNAHSSSVKDMYKYPCGICGKGFKNKSARKVHEAIHKRDKPHMCTYCGRRFTQASNMRYHMRQHTGEKPYRCDTCHVAFTHNVSLKNHLKKQHGIDLWEMGYTGGGRPKKQKVQEAAV